MYLISYNNKDYLSLRRYESRKEAEEGLEYNTFNLIYSYCFGRKPESIILKDSQLKEFFKNNNIIETLKEANLLSEEVTKDKVVDGFYFSLQIYPQLMKDFIKLRRHYQGTDLEYDGIELVRMARAGEADKIRQD